MSKETIAKVLLALLTVALIAATTIGWLHGNDLNTRMGFAMLPSVLTGGAISLITVASCILG